MKVRKLIVKKANPVTSLGEREASVDGYLLLFKPAKSIIRREKNATEQFAGHILAD
jgi:hypothetical protein